MTSTYQFLCHDRSLYLPPGRVNSHEESALLFTDLRLPIGQSKVRKGMSHGSHQYGKVHYTDCLTWVISQDSSRCPLQYRLPRQIAAIIKPAAGRVMPKTRLLQLWSNNWNFRESWKMNWSRKLIQYMQQKAIVLEMVRIIHTGRFGSAGRYSFQVCFLRICNAYPCQDAQVNASDFLWTHLCVCRGVFPLLQS